MLALLLFAQLGSVQFYTRIAPETVYVGQQATYDAVTLVDESGRNALRVNPEYTPSEVRGATVYDFRFDTTLITDVVLRGTRYRRYVYRRALFPLTVGEFEIPPATLRYSLPSNDSYYDREMTYTLQSEPVRFVAVPLPASGRPIDFNGVVGQFSDTAFTDGSSPRIGEAFTLTLRVLGVGNIALLPRPELTIEWANAHPSEERVEWDSTGSVVRGYKEFDWVVTPNVSGDLFIPPIRYDYFNQSTRRYAYASTAKIQVAVRSSGRVSADSFRPPTDQIGTSPFPEIIRILRDYWIVTASALVILLFFIIFIAIRSSSRSSDD